MLIAVKTALSTFHCEVGVCDHCAYCGSPIVWGHDRKGKPVALQPWADCETEAELHIGYCPSRSSLERLERLGRLVLLQQKRSA